LTDIRTHFLNIETLGSVTYLTLMVVYATVSYCIIYLCF